MNPVFNKQLQYVWKTPDNAMLHNNSLVYWAEWTSTSIMMGVNETMMPE